MQGFRQEFHLRRSEHHPRETKLDMESYMKYVHCMIHVMTVRASAYESKISKNADIFLGHKIHASLQEKQAKVKLSGIEEAEEIFERISFKGRELLNKF